MARTGRAKTDLGFTEPPPLAEAIVACADDPELLRNFLAELWTPRERQRFEQRWRVAHCLIQGTDRPKLQSEVVHYVGADAKTVHQVWRWALDDLRVTRPGAGKGATEEIFTRVQGNNSDLE